MPETHIPMIEITLRFGVAALFGMLMGLDRELRGKAIGLRTHMLIALGAAVTTVVSLELYATVVDQFPGNAGDPLRAVQGVAAAIGFLGGGAILRAGDRVRNMTTAADIWLAGAIGLACGGGYFVVALIALVYTLIILTGLRFVEKHLLRRPPEE